ncbi:lysM peptidoglycan-binding domain-containing protein red isoform 1-T1 [Cochliomyia hominivorax]
MDYIVKAYKDWKLHSQFHEIVPDMDDEFMFNEKQSIRESARSLKKYGSTCCNHQIRNNETLVRHDVEKTDTLQGIALKYGCTTEQIRRANRLFASDSLFLRQFLLVPVEKSSPYYPNASTINTNENENNLHNIMDNVVLSGGDPLNCTSSSTLSSASASSSSMCSDSNPRPNALPTRPYSIAGELLVQGNEDESTLSNCNNGNNKQSKSLDSVAAVMTPEEESRRSINEFLSKIDNTISESRKYVEKSKETISNQTDDNLFVATDVVPRRRNNNLNNSYKKQQNQQTHHIRHSSTGSNSDTAQLLNTTQLRKVQNSLKKLEKQQDDFFEL